MAIVLDRARGGGDDLQHLAGADRGERRDSAAITISGTENSGPPAPEKPEPKPETAPTPASSHVLAGAPRPSRGFTGKRT